MTKPNWVVEANWDSDLKIPKKRKWWRKHWRRTAVQAMEVAVAGVKFYLSEDIPFQKLSWESKLISGSKGAILFKVSYTNKSIWTLCLVRSKFLSIVVVYWRPKDNNANLVCNTSKGHDSQENFNPPDNVVIYAWLHLVFFVYNVDTHLKVVVTSF